MKLLTTLTCLVTLTISSACGEDITAAGASGQGENGTTITEVYLRNGVRCEVIDGTQVGAKDLNCDWLGPRVSPSGIDPKGDSGTTITLIQRADGTECAIMDGDAAKAIDCGFGSKR